MPRQHTLLLPIFLLLHICLCVCRSDYRYTAKSSSTYTHSNILIVICSFIHLFIWSEFTHILATRREGNPRGEIARPPLRPPDYHQSLSFRSLNCYHLHHCTIIIFPALEFRKIAASLRPKHVSVSPRRKMMTTRARQRGSSRLPLLDLRLDE